ncbi:MAG: hypothetical protein O7J95_18600 [Planctomycetota bacterium]|nr:hypothetical protein [Planctomycetota bacterium]
MSVLLVLEGLSTDSGPPVGESRRVAARLELPAGAFDGEATREVVLVVRAGETRRFAFKDLRPRVGVPAAVHRLRLVLLFLGAGEGPGSGAPSPFAAVRLELKVVRGSVVPRGMWSVLVPVIISLLSLPAFGLFLRRHSRTGWWRTTGEPLADSLEEPSGGAWWRSER